MARPTAALIASFALVLPAAALGQTAPPAAAYPSTLAGATIAAPVIDLSMLRPHAVSETSLSTASVDRGFVRTSIDYRLARENMFGSVGYFCLSDVSPFAAHEASANAAAKDDRLLGASLRYSF